jgi:hypothetical protein
MEKGITRKGDGKGVQFDPRKKDQCKSADTQEWGFSGHTTINNVTTLLATLHTVWPEWTEVSLTEMLTPESVGKVYKRAVLKVHPDKNTTKDDQTKYLSKKIFGLL